MGLEHTRGLGPPLAHIASEKLAVVRDHSTLVVGALPPEAEEVVAQVVAERHARLVRAPAPAGGFQRRNFAVAAAAAEAFLGRPLDAAAGGGAGAGGEGPGRAGGVARP